MKREYPVIDVARTGQKIKRIMVSRGLTVKDLQQFLGLSTPQGIYHWFDGRCLPTLDNLYALGELFRLPMDAFLCGNRKFIYVGACGDARTRRLYVYSEKMRILKVG